MLVELRDTNSIKPYDRNPRNNDGAVDAVIRSIEQFGLRQPIVIDRDDVVIVGHTRLKAAQQMGLEKVSVHVADLPPEKTRAYRIADNATAAIATWNDDLLPAELLDLKALDVDISALGFSSEELAEWLAPEPTAGLTDADDAPEPAKEAVTPYLVDYTGERPDGTSTGILGPWLANRDADERLWRLPERTAEWLLYPDLVRAGIDYGADGGPVVDMHSFRHGYVTALVRAGVPVKAAQRLARHSDPRLTLNVYSHFTVSDDRAALARAFGPAESPALRMTGT